MISKMLGEKEMPTPLLLVCAILCYGLQLVYSSGATHAVVSKAAHHVTTPKPTPEHSEYHGLYFYYNKYSLEHLLLAKTYSDCYCMPLTEKDVQSIQNPHGLQVMEEHMISQIAQKHFMSWTFDDYEVRDGPWANGCRKRNGSIYRVYRI